MRLVYEKTLEEVKVGDIIKMGEHDVEVKYFRPPHKPSSSGKVTVQFEGSPYEQEYFVGIIGATWIEREDQEGW